ncbi:MAG: SDR family oxidoreductase [Myxococcota bacterium]|nr:SDR family oxidoreductase [Myxococcota bacterium]
MRRPSNTLRRSRTARPFVGGYGLLGRRTPKAHGSGTFSAMAQDRVEWARRTPKPKHMRNDATQDMPEAGPGIGEHVFLTGATGLLGAHLARRILRSHPQTRLSLLVRSTPQETAEQRVEKVVSPTLGDVEGGAIRDRVEVIEGDIALPGFGWTAHVTEQIRARVDHVIHCAATIRFDLPLDVARRDNTEGTRHVLDFARRTPRLGRLDYIGTAYVAGCREGTIKEDELDVGQRFWNSYEQTKMEAEKLVRAFGANHPAAIHRPSIIVGDSRTGQTTAFQGLYQLLPLYLRRLVLAIPADPETPIDLVPIDYVVDTLFALMRTTRSIGRSFHVVAGPDATCTFDELLRIASEFTKIKPPPYVSLETYNRFVKPVFHAVLWGKRRAATLKGEHYLPYLSSKKIFDKTNTDAVAGLGIAIPHPSSYFRRLVAFQARALQLAIGDDPVDDPPIAESAPARIGIWP